MTYAFPFPLKSLSAALALALALQAAPPALAAEQTPKEIVTEALTALFVNGDASAIEAYWAKDYIQHNPMFPSGRDVLTGLVGSMPENFKYEMGMIIAEGDLVAVHGRYTGFGPKPLVAVDIYRVEDGRIAEHWDILQEEVTQTASGNPMFTPTR